MQHNLAANIHLHHKKIDASLLFNVVIIDHNTTDHSFLRKTINTVVPQVMIESIYNAAEALRYFKFCKTAPHFIFLTKDMLHVWGRNMVEFIRSSDLLTKTPLILLANPFSESQKQELLKQGADKLFSRPFEPIDLLKIVGDLNGTWLATIK